MVLSMRGEGVLVMVSRRRIAGQNVYDGQVLPKGRYASGRELEYIDNGCEYSPSCLKCPLPVCKYDAQGIAKK